MAGIRHTSQSLNVDTIDLNFLIFNLFSNRMEPCRWNSESTARNETEVIVTHAIMFFFFVINPFLKWVT